MQGETVAAAQLPQPPEPHQPSGRAKRVYWGGGGRKEGGGPPGGGMPGLQTQAGGAARRGVRQPASTATGVSA